MCALILSLPSPSLLLSDLTGAKRKSPAIIWARMVVVSLRERALGESARDMSTFARGCRATIRELRCKFRLEDTEQNRELQEAFKERSDRRILHALNACNDAKMVCKSYQQKVGRQMETLKKRAYPVSYTGVAEPSALLGVVCVAFVLGLLCRLTRLSLPCRVNDARRCLVILFKVLVMTWFCCCTFCTRL